MDDNWWLEPMRNTFAGRRVILYGGTTPQWSQRIDVLRRVDVGEVLVVGTHGEPADDDRAAGAADTDDRDPVAAISIDPGRPLPLLEQIRFENAAAADLPEHARATIEAFDPDRSAIVVGGFTNEAAELAGRPFVAHRRPEWVAIEDKTTVDAFFDRAGVARQPSAVVALDEAQRTAGQLDRGHGTVWAVDATSGYSGGASGTRWVVDAASAAAALDAFPPGAKSVRVMPFIAGVPCSIHGIVFSDGVIALRPVEMIVLDRRRQFAYRGCCTFWDPPVATRNQMRSVARSVGRQLANEVNFRGLFTVDGIAAADGFWPTEINPRAGAGITALFSADGAPPLLAVNDLIVAGASFETSSHTLESALCRLADDHRGGGTWGWFDPARTDVMPTEEALRYENGRWQPASDHPPDARSRIGPHGANCFYDAERTPVGPSTATRAAAFWNYADPAGGYGLLPGQEPIDG